MLFGIPKRSYKLIPNPKSAVDKDKWCRLAIATNLPQGGYFASRLNSRDSILLEEDCFLAIIEIDDDGIVTYRYELTKHSPGDWAAFNCFCEVGVPYQHFFAEFSNHCVTINMDFHPYTADFYMPASLCQCVDK